MILTCVIDLDMKFWVNYLISYDHILYKHPVEESIDNNTRIKSGYVISAKIE